MSNYYIAAEIAAKLTGSIEAQIAHCIRTGNYTEAKRLNNLLIEAYNDGGWGEHCERWLRNFKDQRDNLNSLINESTSTKRDQGLAEIW